jgi:outer membrane lipoprotein SlyB
LKKAISTLFILTVTGLAGCSNDTPKESVGNSTSSEADTNAQVENGTIKETAEKTLYKH